MLNYNFLNSASEARLEKLLAERVKPKADKAAIDQRIWNLFGEKWSVMFTDLSGFSRGVAQFGIIHFLQTIYESKRLLLPVIDDNEGILMKTEGDSFLILFRKPGQAIQAAVTMQKILQKYNKDRIDEEKVLLCVGIGYGKVLKIGDHDVFGAEVNAASKLGEDTATAGEILVTDSVKDKLKASKYGFEPIDTIPSGAKAAFRVKY